MPKWNTISVSGYHIREAGSTALQELAFTLRDGLEYVQYGVDAGLDVDDFVPRISFFFNSHSDFFEEIAKYRAARKLWAEAMRDRFGAKNPRSWQLRFHTQTAGVSLTAQQPYNNVVRTALQALAAVLGGTNSLHTNSLDEALALPTKEAATIALRTQQIIAHESGVTNVVDPLGGSYFVETLTRDMEEGTLEYWDTIDRMGGMVEAIELGYPQKEIAEASYQFQQAVERREKIIVGVNDFVQQDDKPIEILYIDDTAAERQLARLEELKKTRDNDARAARRSTRCARRRAARATRCRRSRLRARLRHRRRDVRCAARRVGRVRRSADHLAAVQASQRSSRAESRCRSRGPSAGAEAEAGMSQKFESSSPSPVSTGTIGAPRSLPARCATPAWKSSTPACGRRRSRSSARRCRKTPTSSACRSCRARTCTSARASWNCSTRRAWTTCWSSSAVSFPTSTSPKLNAMGIRGVFLPGTPMQHIVDFINDNARARIEQSAPGSTRVSDRF